MSWLFAYMNDGRSTFPAQTQAIMFLQRISWTKEGRQFAYTQDSQFANQFIFADPNGTRVVEKQKFLAFLPQRQGFFKSIGHQSTKVLSLDETPIDNQYTMVKARFLMQFQKSSGQTLEANPESTYILFMKGDFPKIVMHIEPEDVQQAMKERGLV